MSCTELGAQRSRAMSPGGTRKGPARRSSRPAAPAAAVTPSGIPAYRPRAHRDAVRRRPARQRSVLRQGGDDGEGSTALHRSPTSMGPRRRDLALATSPTAAHRRAEPPVERRRPTLSKEPRRMAWRVMIPKSTSTRLSQESEVEVRTGSWSHCAGATGSPAPALTSMTVGGSSSTLLAAIAAGECTLARQACRSRHRQILITGSRVSASRTPTVAGGYCPPSPIPRQRRATGTHVTRTTAQSGSKHHDDQVKRRAESPTSDEEWCVRR
jgi:hypothetical protein